MKLTKVFQEKIFKKPRKVEVVGIFPPNSTRKVEVVVFPPNSTRKVEVVGIFPPNSTRKVEVVGIFTPNSTRKGNKRKGK